MSEGQYQSKHSFSPEVPWPTRPYSFSKESKNKAQWSFKPGTVTSIWHGYEKLPKIAACWTASTHVKWMHGR